MTRIEAVIRMMLGLVANGATESPKELAIQCVDRLDEFEKTALERMRQKGMISLNEVGDFLEDFGDN